MKKIKEKKKKKTYSWRDWKHFFLFLLDQVRFSYSIIGCVEQKKIVEFILLAGWYLVISSASSTDSCISLL